MLIGITSRQIFVSLLQMGKLRIGETGLAKFMWVFWDSGGDYLTQSPASDPCCALCSDHALSGL